MQTYSEMEKNFSTLTKDELKHKDGYMEYLKSRQREKKVDYVTHIFVPDSFLKSKSITTTNHDRFSLPDYHTHNFMEISYILAGTFINIIEGQEIIMNKGDISVLPPHIYHSMDLTELDIDKRNQSYAIHIFIHKDAIKKYLSVFQNDNFEKFINGIINGSSHRKFAFFVCRDSSISEPLIKLLHYTLLNYSPENSKENSFLADSLAASLFSEMLNPERYTLSFSTSFSGNSSSAVDVIEYISRNFRDVTLDRVAAEFNYSFSYTSKLIKQRTGLGFSKLLSNIRLEKSCELLASSDIPVQDIAAECGYNNIEHFHRSFKTAFGVTPSSYRDDSKRY